MTFDKTFTQEEEKDDEIEPLEYTAYMNVMLHEKEPGTKYVVSGACLSGSTQAFIKTWEILKAQFETEMN